MMGAGAGSGTGTTSGTGLATGTGSRVRVQTTSTARPTPATAASSATHWRFMNRRMRDTRCRTWVAGNRSLAAMWASFSPPPSLAIQSRVRRSSASSPACSSAQRAHSRAEWGGSSPSIWSGSSTCLAFEPRRWKSATLWRVMPTTHLRSCSSSSSAGPVPSARLAELFAETRASQSTVCTTSSTSTSGTRRRTRRNTRLRSSGELSLAATFGLSVALGTASIVSSIGVNAHGRSDRRIPRQKGGHRQHRWTHRTGTPECDERGR